MTNREKLHQMTNEELAKAIEFSMFSYDCINCPIINRCHYNHKDCVNQFISWLEAEAEKEE